MLASILFLALIILNITLSYFFKARYRYWQNVPGRVRVLLILTSLVTCLLFSKLETVMLSTSNEAFGILFWSIFVFLFTLLVYSKFRQRDKSVTTV